MQIRPSLGGCLRHGGAGDHAARQMSRLRATKLLVSTAVACVLLCSAPWVLAEITNNAEQEPVYILNAMYSTEAYTDDDAKALWTGMDMAFYSSQYKAAGGRPIKILHPDPDQDNLYDIAEVILHSLARQEKLLAVLGPYLDGRLTAALGNAEVVQSGLVLIAPFTGSSGVRTWSDSVYFTRAEPMVELKVVVKHIINKLRFRRIAFMRLTGMHFGREEMMYVQDTLASLLRDPAVIYSVPYSEISVAVDEAAFDAMADTHPQVIILWAAPVPQVIHFLEKVMTDPRTSSAYIMSCSMIQRVVFDVYKRLLSAGSIKPQDGRILASATTSPVSSSMKYMEAFKTQMADYIEHSGSFDYYPVDDNAEALGQKARPEAPRSRKYTIDEFFQEHPSIAKLMALGWLSGTLVQQTLQQTDWIVNRSTYKAGLFNQNRFVIGGDYVLGDYGGPCEPLAQFLGASCYCNQGGHSAMLTALRNASWYTVFDSSFQYPQSECNSSKSQIVVAVNVLTLLHEGYPKLIDAGMQLNEVLPHAFDSTLCKGYQVGSTFLRVETAKAQLLFDTEVSNYSVDIVAGPILQGLDVGEMFVLNPLQNLPQLRTERRNYVYLMPTLEQQLYVMYATIDALRNTMHVLEDTAVVLRGYSAEEVVGISEILFKTAGTFNLPDPSIAAISLTDSLHDLLSPTAINIVMGMQDGDSVHFANFLAKHIDAMVVVCFDELTMYYEELRATFSVQQASVQGRLMSFSSLPLWTDTSTEAEDRWPILQRFHNIFPDPINHTPSLLRDVVIAGFIQALVSTTTVVETKLLTNAVYINGGVTTYGFTLGTFEWGCTTTTKGESCVYKNFGASSIEILSIQRMLDPTVPQLSPPITPAMEYRPRQRLHALTPAQRNGLIAGCVVGVVVLITTCTLILYCCMDSRNNDAAPKDGDEPVTLLFTDIESSTALWAALPQLMADAIAAHHRVIRQLLKKYGGYEVKTIGDSFMIACRSAHSAVSLACEIQTKLLKHDWGTEALDSAYHKFELARVDTLDDYVPPTARLSEEEYAALWRGLRVRMGIHTGLTDIRYDEVTKGYDYYGDTPNMAARTEAVANGGQVLATEATWWALSNDERAGTAHTVMGPQGLRGVPFAVEMFQLNAVPGRRHAALRTEIEAMLPEDTATETASSAAGALLSSVGTMSDPAAGIAFVLTSCFAPYPAAQRVRELQPLLSKWGVGAPPRSRLVSEEDYCQGLMNRLAVRIATVSQARLQLTREDAADGGLKRASSEALNPLAREGDCAAGGVRPRVTGSSAASLPVGIGSAMREWHVRSRLMNDTGRPSVTHVSQQRASQLTSHTEAQDAVFRLSALSVPESTVESSGADDEEIVIVRVSRNPHYARHAFE
ncbi:receptor-type adenylate cyclase a [Leishmania major strain Friedlin]|uniref:adenylate cyclase n=1 Tax=Leishmania major TaxID=5664 RepID=Q4QEI3_LEIMA|nr:receptor-type adenylate cyclase a [Leishmania major strain Friedlin]CAG9572235.1 receptor-type_adenylate_cyclase_-_putative [Leishmania major strain Friedlin]CAJ03424.1 receptor-type adenylate cyclase a [Leishmania major strain Friedlin]|eukprot:XP_001682265.1 receptor-type adenylate cyclase a [Leishmania major strain Friedlin]